VHAWVRAYPPDIFPAFWERLDNAIGLGQIVASREVLEELRRKADDLFKWANDRPLLFVEIDDRAQEIVIEIMAKFPKFVDERTTKSAADPFVIALGECYAPHAAIVTQERGGTDEKPKIPHVCQSRGMRSMQVLDLIRELQWRF
jgi:hypothetical protein